MSVGTTHKPPTPGAKEWPPVDLIADLSLHPNAHIEKELDENVLCGKY